MLPLMGGGWWAQEVRARSASRARMRMLGKLCEAVRFFAYAIGKYAKLANFLFEPLDRGKWLRPASSLATLRTRPKYPVSGAREADKRFPQREPQTLQPPDKTVKLWGNDW